MFAELLGHPGVTERAKLRSRFGFMAVHGGSLERGTAEIAALVAARAGASVYAVIQPPDLRWHLPSHRVDPAASAALASFLDHVEVVVSLHGYARDGHGGTLLVGGADRVLANRVGARLRHALPGYDIVDDVDVIPAALRGLHPANPVNLARGGGVQLELPPRVRGFPPAWDGFDGPAPPPSTEALVGALTELAAGR